MIIDSLNMVSQNVNQNQYRQQTNAYQKFNKKNPLWQSNYHDHIIRDEMEYRRIAEYIVNNPLKWNEDILSNIEKITEN